jgi:glyoxylase-like metal-dependent hydrolase (beta-lactamase superfamily II)
MGFSTGRFVGNALEVRTTHLKQGWYRRNGTPESDQATLVEFFVRHGDRLTHTVVVSDPVYLEAPFVTTTDFFRQPSDHQNWLFPCDDGEQVFGRASDDVPNYLFGQNPFVREYRAKHKLAGAGHLGGAASIRPEIVSALAVAKDDPSLERPARGPQATSKAAPVEPSDGQIHIQRVRGNVYMLVGDGGNIVVQVGDEGVFVVDTGSGARSDKVLAAIRTLSENPIQFIANTSFHPDRTGGNDALSKAGADLSVRGTFFSLQFRDAGVGATVMAHQNVQNRMNAANRAADAIPTDTFLEERRRTFHNGDAIEMLWMPNAVTDGDSLVHFRRADVIVAGNVFTTTRYPLIDVANGGTVDGAIKALNQILDRTVFEHQGQGGTLVVPGHGYLSDEHEVVEYRDMIAIVRDRVGALVRSGATFEQVKAARPTADYDTRYGATAGPWTTDMFVEAVYRTIRR